VRPRRGAAHQPQHGRPRLPRSRRPRPRVTLVPAALLSRNAVAPVPRSARVSYGESCCWSADALVRGSGPWWPRCGGSAVAFSGIVPRLRDCCGRVVSRAVRDCPSHVFGDMTQLGLTELGSCPRMHGAWTVPCLR
jgi:hypothetical protein